MFFKFGDRSTSDSSELTAICFPLDLLGVKLSPTMFAITFGYSTSEKDFFFRDRHLLAEFEAADNRLKTEVLVIWKLQWQSETTAEMSPLGPSQGRLRNWNRTLRGEGFLAFYTLKACHSECISRISLLKRRPRMVLKCRSPTLAELASKSKSHVLN